MDNKKLLIGAGVVVAGLLVYNYYYNRMKKVSTPLAETIENEPILKGQEQMISSNQNLSGAKLSKALGSGEIIEATYKK